MKKLKDFTWIVSVYGFSVGVIIGWSFNLQDFESPIISVGLVVLVSSLLVYLGLLLLEESLSEIKWK